MLVSAEGVGIAKDPLYIPQTPACMQGEIHTIYAWRYAYCKAENDCVVMGDLSLLFYFFLVTFVVFNVPIILFMCERWYFLVMSFFFFFSFHLVFCSGKEKRFCFYWNSPQAYVLYSGYQIIESTCDIHKSPYPDPAPPLYSRSISDHCKKPSLKPEICL